MDERALLLLLGAVSNALALVLWYLLTQTRASVHSIRNEMQKVVTDVAVLKARSEERAAIIDLLRDVLQAQRKGV